MVTKVTILSCKRIVVYDIKANKVIVKLLVTKLVTKNLVCHTKQWVENFLRKRHGFTEKFFASHVKRKSHLGAVVLKYFFFNLYKCAIF